MTVTPMPDPEDRREAQRDGVSTPGGDGLTDTERFIHEMLGRLDAADMKSEHLERALIHSRDIGAAVGILMAHHKAKQDEAFQMLRHASQNQNRKLYDLALDVIRVGDLSTREP